MSTQTIRERPVVTGLGTGRSLGWPKWIKKGWAKVIARKKVAIAGVAAVAVVGVASFYFLGAGTSTPQYMSAKVERGNLRNTVTATGTLQAVTTVQVGSQASGTISALYADFNSVVKKGQVVAQLDPSVAKAQVDQSRANLQQARASLQQAIATVSNSRAGVSDAQAKALAARSTVQNNQAGVSGAEANVAVLKAQQDDAMSFLKQQEALVQSGVIAQRELDVAKTSYKTAEARYDQAVAQLNQAKLSQQSSASSGVAQSQAQLQQSQAQVQQSQAQVQQAQAQVQQAEAALQLAEVNLSHTTITSPIDGIVVSRDVNVGQTVAASLSAPTLFTIANDLTQMQIIANIDQADIGLVEQAKSVKFSVDAFPGKEFDGKIQQMRLNPQNVQNVVTYNVMIDVSNPDQKLKPGMTANLIITIDERNNVLKVPNAALRFTPQDASTRRGQGQGQRTGAGSGSGQRRRQQGDGSANAGASSSDNQQENGERRFAPASAPVLEGQTRLVWVLGQDGKPQARRIKVGLTDGVSTEVVEGNLQEGETVITGQTLNSSTAQSNQTTAPGFGGAQRGGGGRRN
ncbi:MAG TPA: efflux RND transporter periplasmic adaptor subunit [Pyrinomonadaceae bacterium]|nr:efflux RND transporter periplasmic adaptor subunit [Pyrinomonadaceae bacterium]